MQKPFSLKSYKDPNPDLVDKLVQRPGMTADHLDSVIDEVFQEVRKNGDDALLQYTERFDGIRLTNLNLGDEEKYGAIQKLSAPLKSAIDHAYENIRTFHQTQILEEKKIETDPGVMCWREARAIEKVGLYIPGGSAPLFSTVLMLGVPAQIAGCEQVILCTPPGRDGSIHPAILFAAEKCGIRNCYKLGGAQAIAAMVYGTTTIPAVYKIFGPGNQYVTAAKIRAQTLGVAIDLPAGPSEVLVYADQSARTSFIASDLLAQAEHGPDSQVVLVTTQNDLVETVSREINNQLKALPRANIAAAALQHAYACIFESKEEAFQFINQYAPEHLILSSDKSASLIPLIRNAGSVFIGNWTPESAGDYASGTNHTLPTSAFARASGGVSLDSFVKKITFQEISKKGLQRLGPTIIELAKNEELMAHAQSVQIRMNNL